MLFPCVCPCSPVTVRALPVRVSGPLLPHHVGCVSRRLMSHVIAFMQSGRAIRYFVSISVCRHERSSVLRRGRDGRASLCGPPLRGGMSAVVLCRILGSRVFWCEVPGARLSGSRQEPIVKPERRRQALFAYQCVCTEKAVPSVRIAA